jgi:hypothetical protein
MTPVKGWIVLVEVDSGRLLSVSQPRTLIVHPDRFVLLKLPLKGRDALFKEIYALSPDALSARPEVTRSILLDAVSTARLELLVGMPPSLTMTLADGETMRIRHNEQYRGGAGTLRRLAESTLGERLEIIDERGRAEEARERRSPSNQLWNVVAGRRRRGFRATRGMIGYDGAVAVVTIPARPIAVVRWAVTDALIVVVSTPILFALNVLTSNEFLFGVPWYVSGDRDMFGYGVDSSRQDHEDAQLRELNHSGLDALTSDPGNIVVRSGEVQRATLDQVGRRWDRLTLTGPSVDVELWSRARRGRRQRLEQLLSHALGERLEIRTESDA